MTAEASRPLYELADDAPAISQIVRPDTVRFPYSNDDSIGSFREALSRVDTLEYQQATNRVAVLIGESALSTNIQYIPEETIVLLDRDVAMVQHMTDYVRYFATAPNSIAWGKQMGLNNSAVMSEASQETHQSMLLEQADWWEQQGEEHAFSSLTSFNKSQALIREKAIIPWHGDITQEADMELLGNALRRHKGIVTLLNLSNVIPYSATKGEHAFTNAANYADMLERLPLTPHAPILTAARHRVSSSNSLMVAATGPYFGLNHLRHQGGDSQKGPVACLPDYEKNLKVASAFFEILLDELSNEDPRLWSPNDPA